MKSHNNSQSPRRGGDTGRTSRESLIYEEIGWMPAGNYTGRSFKLQIRITKNMNLRIELWRCFDQVEDYPIYAIVPYARAKKIMTQCEYDIERFSKLINLIDDQTIKIAPFERKVSKLQLGDNSLPSVTRPLPSFD